MPLILTDEQTMLKEAADGFLGEHAPIAHLRKLRDERDPDGVSRDLWRAFGEMGFAGVIIPEALGGMGLGAVEAGVMAEALGRTLTPSPFLGSGVLSAKVLVDGRQLLSFCGNDYLGLSQHLDVVSALQEAAAWHGVGSTGSAGVSGHHAEHAAFEREVARLCRASADHRGVEIAQQQLRLDVLADVRVAEELDALGLEQLTVGLARRAADRIDGGRVPPEPLDHAADGRGHVVQGDCHPHDEGVAQAAAVRVDRRAAARVQADPRGPRPAQPDAAAGAG